MRKRSREASEEKRAWSARVNAVSLYVYGYTPVGSTLFWSLFHLLWPIGEGPSSPGVLLRNYIVCVSAVIFHIAGPGAAVLQAFVQADVTADGDLPVCEKSGSESQRKTRTEIVLTRHACDDDLSQELCWQRL